MSLVLPPPPPLSLREVRGKAVQALENASQALLDATLLVLKFNPSLAQRLDELSDEMWTRADTLGKGDD